MLIYSFEEFLYFHIKLSCLYLTLFGVAAVKVLFLLLSFKTERISLRSFSALPLSE